ncbi:manganese and iron superoxide dismutase [Teratosphaeria nubilosa]|uniref:Manganese and iron superoxide dismutase n=1 Tax=Teratosphaeria nubilosa TaxID=161662 RepID=A0A6G1L8U5_9PEZI|nr:manganese and iron superoxide dismutase [Teratosphaeria nubilosa]
MITRRFIRPSGALPLASWTCPSCTRASLLSRSRHQSRRGLQQMPTHERKPQEMPDLPHAASFEVRGVPGLLSVEGYRIAWTSYQNQLLDKLNDLLAGEPYAIASPKALTLQFAKDPMSASIFNHASAAHNNHFFFQAFSLAPTQLQKYPALETSFTNVFGSIKTLELSLLNSAAGMFGPGYTWLVWARDLDSPTNGPRRGTWRILNTYSAGTPYPEAGYRRQGLDMNTNNASSYADYVNQEPLNTLGAFGRFSQVGRDQAKLPPGGTNIVPVLCVSTWEHTFLRDYGITGKRAYLKDWWNVIDWSVVDGNTPYEAKQDLHFARG